MEDEYDIFSSTVTGIELRDGRTTSKSNIGYKIIDIDDVVLSPQNLWLGNINLNSFGKGLVSPSYKTYKIVELVPSFLGVKLKTVSMMSAYESVSIKGASTVRRNLDLDAFYKLSTQVPDNNKEQQSIGSTFKHLDQLITAEETKQKLLTTMQQALLQQLLV